MSSSVLESSSIKPRVVKIRILLRACVGANPLITTRNSRCRQRPESDRLCIPCIYSKQPNQNPSTRCRPSDRLLRHPTSDFLLHEFQELAASLQEWVLQYATSPLYPRDRPCAVLSEPHSVSSDRIVSTLAQNVSSVPIVIKCTLNVRV